MGILTVKGISTVERIGSSETTSRRLTNLSKAAGKFNAMIGVSVKNAPRNSKTTATDAAVQPGNNARTSNVHVETWSIECDPTDAALIADYIFNKMESLNNSEKYTERKAHFDTCKLETLKSLGVQSYADLSSDQRMVYAKRMTAQKAPFIYTSKVIHIKYDDNRTVYSRSFRALGTVHWTSNAFNLEDILSKERRTKTATFRPIGVSQNQNPSDTAGGTSGSGTSGVSVDTAGYDASNSVMEDESGDIPDLLAESVGGGASRPENRKRRGIVRS